MQSNVKLHFPTSLAASKAVVLKSVGWEHLGDRNFISGLLQKARS